MADGGGNSSSKSDAALSDIAQATEEILELVRRGTELVENVTAESQEGMAPIVATLCEGVDTKGIDNSADMVKQLSVMHERQQHLGQMAVPRSLLELLDAGRSAEAFNQQVLLETLGEAERVELSSATLKGLRDDLESRLSSVLERAKEAVN